MGRPVNGSVRGSAWRMVRALALLASLAPALAAQAQSTKKGFCGRGGAAAINKVRPVWYYTWSVSAYGEAAAQFVPMLFGADKVTTANLNTIEEQKTTQGVKQLLGFNEPDSSGQGNTTVAEALAAWPKLVGTDLTLVSPSPVQGSGGQAWLDDFMDQANTRGYRVNAVGYHNYTSTAGSTRSASAAADTFISQLTSFHSRYGKPVWITEFGDKRVFDGTSDLDDNFWFLWHVLPRLENLSWVSRYAWYSADSAKHGLAYNGALTSIGVLYKTHDSVPGLLDTAAYTEVLSGYADTPFKLACGMELLLVPQLAKYGAVTTVGDDWLAAASDTKKYGTNGLAIAYFTGEAHLAKDEPGPAVGCYQITASLPGDYRQAALGRLAQLTPTIGNVVNQTVDEDTSTAALACTVGSDYYAASALTLTRASSNHALVPTANIVLGGSGANRTVRVTPAANESGTATITLTVSDGALTASDTFDLAVNPVNDGVSLVAPASRTVPAGCALAVTNRAADPDLPAQELRFRLAAAPAAATIDATNGIIRWQPTPAQAGTQLFSVVVAEAGWTLSPTDDAYVTGGTGSTNNYGAAPGLAVKTASANVTRESFLRFSLAGIPAAIDSATLRLAVRASAMPGVHGYARGLDESWNERTITWDTKPACGATPLATWLPPDVAPAAVAVPVTSAARADLGGDRLLTLRVFATNQTGNGYVEYGSREDPVAANRPRLELQADAWSVSATQTFRVVVAPPPALDAPALGADGALALHVPMVGGLTYRIEAATNLLSPKWSPLGARTATSNGPWLFVDGMATNHPRRFYRVRLEP